MFNIIAYRLLKPGDEFCFTNDPEVRVKRCDTYYYMKSTNIRHPIGIHVGKTYEIKRIVKPYDVQEHFASLAIGTVFTVTWHSLYFGKPDPERRVKVDDTQYKMLTGTDTGRTYSAWDHKSWTSIIVLEIPYNALDHFKSLPIDTRFEVYREGKSEGIREKSSETQYYIIGRVSNTRSWDPVNAAEYIGPIFDKIEVIMRPSCNGTPVCATKYMIDGVEVTADQVRKIAGVDPAFMAVYKKKYPELFPPEQVDLSQTSWLMKYQGKGISLNPALTYKLENNFLTAYSK